MDILTASPVLLVSLCSVIVAVGVGLDDHNDREHNPAATPLGCLLLTTAIMVASGVAAWWIVGPQHERGGYGQILPPVTESQSADLNAGASGLIFVGCLLVALFIRHRRRPLRTAWWIILYLYVAVGAVAGAGGRWVTAETNGANIGGALILVGGAPTLALVLTAATWWSLALLKRDAQTHDPGLSPTEVRRLAFCTLGLGILGWTPLGLMLLFFPLPVTATVVGTAVLLDLRGQGERTLRTVALWGLALAIANIGLVAGWLFASAT